MLQFSGATNSVRVVLGFYESTCSAGLDSGNPAQQEPCTLPGSTTLSGSTTSSGVSNTSNVSLSWTASTGATGYKIYNSTDNVTFNLLTTVGAVTSATNVDTITGGTSEYYRIVPTKACGDGPTSNTITIRTVRGTISKTAIVTNITPASVTITTTTTSASCTDLAGEAVYTCTMPAGSGNIIVGNYSTGTGNNDNKVCLPNPVTTYGTPWGAKSGTDGSSSEKTTFTFTNLTTALTFDVLIARESVADPSGYTCYP